MMSVTNAASVTTVEKYGRTFWERLWRTAGIQATGLFVVSWMILEYQPQAAVLFSLFGGLAVLNLMWFAAAISATLADAGQDGWGAAVTAASATVGTFLFLVISMVAVLMHQVPAVDDSHTTLTMKNLIWSFAVLSSFPRAMLIMSGSFGLWRAKLISNAQFALFVTAVVLVLAGGTTWLGGAWAPNGIYSTYVSPVIGLFWIVAVSRVVLRAPPTRTAW